MSRAWANLPERGSIAALSLMAWIVRHIGARAGELLLYPISLYYVLTARRARRGSFHYLRRILAREPRPMEQFRHFHCFARTILDRLLMLAGQLDRFQLDVSGGERILAQVRAGKGCLLLGAHLGSFEALRALGVSLQHFPIKVLMNVDHNATTSAFFARLNPEIAETIIPIAGPDTLITVREWLERGYMIGALGDRVVADDQVLVCRFLGDPAAFPAGPLRLAAMLQCPVILAFALYRGGNRYEVHFEPFAEVIPANDRRSAAALTRWAQRYADRLEHYARLAPYNWFNFYDFWGDESPGRCAGAALRP
jgi:predicted LPLAT superfamily acyltransferase